MTAVHLETIMKPWLVLLVLIGAVDVSVAQTYEGISRPFVLKAAIDTVLPEIRIVNPPLGGRSRWTTGDGKFVIKGSVSHRSGIKSVQANGTEARVESDGPFEATLNLTEGANPVTITVTSVTGTRATLKFEIVLDTTSPRE